MTKKDLKTNNSHPVKKQGSPIVPPSILGGVKNFPFTILNNIRQMQPTTL